MAPSLDIDPLPATLLLGKTITFSPRFVPAAPAPAPAPPPPSPSFTWKVSAIRAGLDAGTIDAKTGAYAAPKLGSGTPPKRLKDISPAVVIEVTEATSGLTKALAIDLVAPWPKGWPTLSDTELPWDKEQVWMARILWDLLESLPPDVVKWLDGVHIRRATDLGGPQAAHHNPWQGHISVDEQTVQAELPGGVPSNDQYQRIADLLLHEMGHKVMAMRCGGPGAFWADLVATLPDALFTIGLQGVGVATAILCAPLLPLEIALFGATAFGKDALDRDFVSEYANETQWVMWNLGALKVPFFGLLMAFTTSTAPNMFTSSIPFLGHRNERLGKTHDELTALNATDAATVTQTLQAAGMPSLYAATSVQEDFAETLLYVATGLDNVRWRHVSPWTAEDAGRVAFFTDKARGLLPSTWKIPTKANPPYTKSNLWDATSGKGWTFDTSAASADAEASTSVKASSVFTALATWQREVAPRIEHLRGTMSEIFSERLPTSALEMAREVESRGDGLALYGGPDDEPGDTARVDRMFQHRAATGDVLVEQSGTTWMVQQVDEEGRVVAVTGKSGLFRKGVSENDLRFDRARIALHWRPTVEPRVFAANGEASGEYADVNGTLRKAVTLWGLESAPASKRSLRTAGGFLAELLDLGGLVAEGSPLRADASADLVLAHCDTHGDGLVPIGPDTRLRVGDVVIPYHRSTVGVVLRAGADGRVDILTGGTFAEGRIGETKAAVKVLHAVAVGELHWTWSPSKRPRSFTAENHMASVFTNLNEALAHLRRHVGASELRRNEKTIEVRDDDAMPILVGLLLERGTTPEARAALGPYGFGSPWFRTRNQALLKGEATVGDTLRPGDLIGWNDSGGVARCSVVLEVGEGGAPTRTITVREGKVALSETAIPVASIHEIFRLGLAPRALAGTAEIAAFYGTPSALERMVTARNPNAAWEDSVQPGGNKITYWYERPPHRARLASFGAPRWVCNRVHACDSMADVRACLDSLGEGVVPFAPGTSLPIGAWLFVAGGELEILLANAADGSPGLVLRRAGTAYGFGLASPAAISGVWLPSSEPRKRVEQATTDGYEDLNREIGALRLWAATQADQSFYDDPLFTHAGALVGSGQSPRLVQLLGNQKRSTDAWVVFFSGLGKGVEVGAPEPGDFLFLPGGVRGVMLDRGEMLTVVEQKIRIGPARDVKLRWRPSATARTA